jgi:hypothetical protein
MAVLLSLRPALTDEQRRTARYLRDLIDSVTLDARPPVKLPVPRVELESEDEIVPVHPRCCVCRVRDARASASHDERVFVSCDDLSCIEEAFRRWRLEHPLAPSRNGRSSTLYEWRRRAREKESKR